MLSNGQSDSDSVSHSPPPINKAHRISEGEDGSVATADKEKDVVEGGSGVSAQDGKLVRVALLSKHQQLVDKIIIT